MPNIIVAVVILVIAAVLAGVLTEVLSPLLLILRGRLLAAGLLFFGYFHLVTWLTIRIHFLPTVVCLLAFVPLERIPDVVRRLSRARRRPAWLGYRQAAEAARASDQRRA